MSILLKNCAIHGQESADILVENGLICAVGEIETADTIYDMSDYAVVMPGVIDAHIHMITGNIEYHDAALRSWAQSGVTTVRDLGIGDQVSFRPVEDFIAYRETIETPECAHCLTSGRFVSCENGYGHKMGPGDIVGLGCKDVQEVIDAINHQLDIGCEGVKTGLERGSPMVGERSIIPPDMLKALVQTAVSRGVWCCAHVLDAEFVPMLLDAGMPELAHMPTDSVPDEVLERMVKQGVTCVPTICTIKAPRPPLPEGAELPPPPPGFVPPDTDAMEAACIDNVARFVKMGGTVAVGTDAMRMEVQPHVASMPVREFQLLHAAGLSVAQVIDAATIHAAEICKIDNEVGSIAVGKKANIIALRESIDETFQALGHVEFVMNRGCVIKN